tara:strand:+ start:1576 stop:1713 length:138 start_codon:yes stop_codon:yes gene_type:complete
LALETGNDAQMTLWYFRDGYLETYVKNYVEISLNRGPDGSHLFLS